MKDQLDKSNIERLIINTVTVLCKNSIPYSNKLRIQGTLGITVDASSIVLVQINEYFGYDVESAEVNVSAPDRRGASATVPTNTYAPGNIKRPRISSVVHCTRRPVGQGHGRLPVPPVRRVRSGPAVRSATGSAQRAHQQPTVPSPSNLALTNPSQAAVTPLCKSPQFRAGGVPAGNVPVKSKTPQQLTAKVEVEERGQSGTRMTQQQHLLSSGVICVDSDDETEHAAEMKPDVRASTLIRASEGQSQDTLQKIVDTAVMAARAGRPSVVESSAPSSLSCTIAHVAGLNVHYSEGNSCQGDVKPVTESAENSVQPWTPSKQLILSSSKMQPSTPTGIKTEVGAYLPVFSSSKPLHLGSMSKLHSSPGVALPVDATSKDALACKAMSWTSVTETTFICTTAGCAKHFTTKRALVRHQKDKHGLVTQQMLAGAGQMESDSSDTASAGL